MVKIVIENWGQKQLILPEAPKTMLHHFLEEGLDWMHACGGKGRCTTCRVQVIEGIASLTDLTAVERKYMEAGLLTSTERLSCQTRVAGDMRIRIPDDCKLPHIDYGQANKL